MLHVIVIWASSVHTGFYVPHTSVYETIISPFGVFTGLEDIVVGWQPFRVRTQAQSRILNAITMEHGQAWERVL